jgi:hypothetical protein
MSSADRFVIPPQRKLEGAAWVPDRPTAWEQGTRRPQRPIYPPPPPPTDQVVIYARDVLLCDRRRVSPGQSWHGDLGILPNGELRARWRVKMNDGTATYGYMLFDPEADIEQPLPAPTDWAGRLAFRLLEAGGATFFHELAAPPPGENDRLIAEFPELAAKIGITRTPAPPSLFELGRIRYPKVLHRSAGLIPALGYWHALVLNHSQGHWGLAGEFQAVGTVSEAEIWMGEELEVAVQNAVAIKTGLGAVRSYYRLPEGAAAVLREHAPWQSPPPPPVIAVLTVLGRGGETLLSVAPLPG